jgi:uncharacterized membrane protein
MLPVVIWLFNMAHIITAIFPNPELAKSAIQEIKDLGFDTDDISAMAQDGFGGKHNSQNIKGGSVGDSAATGGVLGILFGLLAAPAALVMPGVGPMLIFGPMAVWGITGTVTGGLLGSLTTSGYPEEVAKNYENQISQGKVLMAVQADHSQEDLIKDTIRRHGGGEEHVLHKSYKT